MKKTILFLMLFLFCSLLAGCVQHLGNFSALATGTYRAENIKDSSLVAKNVKGESCRYNFLIFPLGVPKIDEAVSEALAKNNGDFLMNARLYRDWWVLPFITGQACWVVEGDVYKTNK